MGKIQDRGGADDAGLRNVLRDEVQHSVTCVDSGATQIYGCVILDRLLNFGVPQLRHR